MTDEPKPYTLTRADIAVIYGWLLAGSKGTTNSESVTVSGSELSVLGITLFHYLDMLGYINSDGIPVLAKHRTSMDNYALHDALKELLETEGYIYIHPNSNK
jgi:hypothetical protein